MPPSNVSAPFPSENLAIVLVEPKTPGNVGAVARAMKVMGLNQLKIINPERDPHSREAWWMAHGAADVLGSLEILPSLEKLAETFPVMVGTTHRHGRERGTLRSPKSLLPEIVTIAKKEAVAILFGREDKGLSNSELSWCSWFLHIPNAATMPSLNLSQAVMVVAYELFTTEDGHESADEEMDDSVISLTGAEVEAIVMRLTGLVSLTPYQAKGGASQLRRSIRDLLKKSPLDAKDARLIHGICRALVRRIERRYE